MKAKHVLIVADSCFTASERREAGLPEENGLHDRLSKLRARVVLSSGALEPIQPGSGGRHSVFTGAFLKILDENREILLGSRLFEEMREALPQDMSQSPEYADVRESGHERGDFLFVPRP